jgi:hypothetical protein
MLQRAVLAEHPTNSILSHHFSATATDRTGFERSAAFSMVLAEHPTNSLFACPFVAEKW